MTTEDFNRLLVEQQKAASFDREKLSAAIDVLRRDVESIHRSRHETQENLALTINEMRLDQAKTAENLASLVASVTELVAALKGNTYGSVGLVAQVADHEKRIDAMEEIQKEARGMSRLIAWGVSAIGLALVWKNLQR